MLSGQIIHAGPQTQISLRLIETETGQIRAAISESFGSAVPASIMAGKLAGRILNKLRDTYPIRGKITQSKDGNITLGIGENVGLKAGQQFKVINTDLMLEVVATQSESGDAKIVKGEIVEGSGHEQIGMRVEIEQK